MLQIPVEIARRFTDFIKRKGVRADRTGYYLKWLRYYLDFCHKYGFKTFDREGLTAFLEKLKAKNQAESLRKQAHHAVSLYHEMVASSREAPIYSEKTRESDKENYLASPPPSEQYAQNNRKNPRSQPFSAQNTENSESLYASPEAGALPKTSGADWTPVFTELEKTIKIRHYSPKTLKAYSGWTRKFQTFLKSKDPSLITTDDVKEFLSWLATERNISASSQNQAFNALLFLFRNVFNKEFGRLDGIVRAKRRRYIPVVLSREEVDRVIGFLRYPHKLIVSLMYGCGLRISECLSLRVHNFNFDMGILTIHDGKGKKDRTVSIPRVLEDDLKRQLATVTALHEQDCNDGYDGVFLYGRLEKKYRNASKELIWQWFFPAKALTLVPETGEFKRYHIHETVIQKAVRRAVQKAQIPKRVTAHTFRHSFASHLLQANYDIRTIQQLLGHSDVRTTMIYTHTVKSRTLKEAASPLDF
jgi:integron integrase